MLVFIWIPLCSIYDFFGQAPAPGCSSAASTAEAGVQIASQVRKRHVIVCNTVAKGRKVPARIAMSKGEGVWCCSIVPMCRECRASSDRGGGFTAGFLTGGVIFGALGFLFAPQVRLTAICCIQYPYTPHMDAPFRKHATFRLYQSTGACSYAYRHCLLADFQSTPYRRPKAQVA